MSQENIMPIIYMPELMLQRMLEIGIYDLQTNSDKINDIFTLYTLKEFSIYGQEYIDKIKKWVVDTEIPVVQAWGFNPDRIPSISVHLNRESEDESKSAVNDHWGFNGEYNIGVNAFSVSLDIGVHASKDSNYVLWLYYMIHYILFTYKLKMEGLGFQLQTIGVSDYIRDQKYEANNIWSRWITFNAIVENCWRFIDTKEYEAILKMHLSSSASATIEPGLGNVSDTLILDRKIESNK